MRNPEAKFAEFDSTHRSALQDIREHMSSDNEDVRLLVNWLLATDANPYGFLSPEWASAMKDAVSFARLCHMIWHAFEDDGSISFVTVGGTDPRISFVDPCERYELENDVLSYIEKQHRDYGFRGKPVSYDLGFIKGSKAFIEARECYESEVLKRCFLADLRRGRDADEVAKRYASMQAFRNEWLLECSAS